MRSLKMVLLAGLAPVALMATQTAWAQDGGEEVVVTAQKRSQALQDVPAAISSFSSATLERRDIDTVESLALQTPGLVYGKEGGVDHITIRGVGVGIATGAVPAGVATHIDGVYQPRLTLGDFAQSDLARIELLRGPQGTLYGRNATAGAINFISAPPTDTFEGRVETGYAEFGDFHAQTVLSGPISDKVRARLLLDYRDRADGFTTNLYPGASEFDARESLAGRLRVQYDVSEALTLDLTAYAFHQTGPADVAVVLDDIRPYALAFNPGLAAATYTTRPNELIADGPMDLSKDATGAAITLSWDVGFGTLKSISSYATYHKDEIHDADSTSYAFETLARVEDTKTWTQELNLSGKTGNLDWLVGGYYFNDDFDGSLDLNFPSGGNLGLGLSLQPNGSIQFLYLDKTEAYAAFADVTYELADDFRLILGARYSVDRKDFTQSQHIRNALLVPPATPVPVPVPQIAACEDLNLTPKYEAFTPRVGLQYDVTDEQHLYAAYSKGYKSGGLNFSTCNNEFSPEKITSYEVGYKARFMEGKLTLNISAYHYDFRDQQIFQVIGASAIVVNADETTMNGGDVELFYQPNDHWSFNAGLALLDAKFGDFLTADPLDPTGTVQNLKGNVPPYAPKWTLSLGAEYRTTMYDDIGQFTLRAEYYHSADVYLREFNQPFDMQTAYDVANAYLIWDSPDDSVTAKLFVKNFTDERYTVTRFSAGLTGQMQGTWATPRQVGVELIGRF